MYKIVHFNGWTACFSSAVQTNAQTIKESSYKIVLFIYTHHPDVQLGGVGNWRRDCGEGSEH